MLEEKDSKQKLLSLECMAIYCARASKFSLRDYQTYSSGLSKGVCKYYKGLLLVVWYLDDLLDWLTILGMFLCIFYMYVWLHGWLAMLIE